jgi:hypothetical protein
MCLICADAKKLAQLPVLAEIRYATAKGFSVTIWMYAHGVITGWHCCSLVAVTACLSV